MATPTFSPTPDTTLPISHTLTGLRHEPQWWNNCGAATLGTCLSFWGFELTQGDIAPLLKPDPEDKHIDFTEDEWQWCLANEKRIHDHASERFEASDQETIRQYHQWHQYVWPDSPDRLAYFIGYRICESYVDTNGPDSWREIYDLSPAEALSRSGYGNWSA